MKQIRYNTILLLFAISLLSIQGYSQRETDNWIFGSVDNWIIMSDTGAVGYTPSYFTPWTVDLIETMRSSSISDPQGNLISYTCGEHVYNNQFNTYTSMGGSQAYLYKTGPKVYIPIHKKPNAFIIIRGSYAGNYSTKAYEYDPANNSFTFNSNSSGGVGGIGKIAATYHANGKEIWVVSHDAGSGFVAFLRNEDGYTTDVVNSYIGSSQANTPGVDPYQNVQFGIMKISPGGNFIAMSSTGLDIIELYDFDNETGVVSNRCVIPLDRAFSLEFSSNGTMLYYSQLYASALLGGSHTMPDSIPVFQVDVLAGSDSLINASRYHASAPSLYSNLYNGNEMQLASNQNIYINMDAEGIAVIEEPNLAGAACAWDDDGVIWPANYGGVGFQNLPEFFSSWLDFNIVMDDFEQCLGDTSMFYTKTNQGFDSICWELTDPTLGSFSFPNQDTVIHCFTEPGEFDITLKRYRNGVVDELKKRQFIYPHINIDLPEDTLFCEGTITSLVVSVPYCEFAWVNHYTPDPIFYYPKDTVFSDTAIINTSDPNDTEEWWPILLNHSEYCGSMDSTFVLIHPIPDLLPNDTSDICIDSPITLDATADSAFNYTWSTGETTATIVALANGLYHVTLEQGLCTFSDSIFVTYEESIPVELDDYILQCDSDVVQIYAGDFPADYIWFPNGETGNAIQVDLAGWYGVVISNSCGDFTDSIKVIALDPPNVNLPFDTIACAGDTVLLDVYNPYSSYSWLGGMTDSIYPATLGGTYSVTVSNQCGNDFGSVTVILKTQPDPNLGNDQNICLGDDTELSPQTSQTAEYLWSTGDTTESIFVSNEGLFWLILSNVCGEFSDSVYVSVHENTFQFSSDSAILDAGNTLVIDAGLGYNSYFWSTSEISSSIEVTNTGMYWVEVSDSIGCIGSDTIEIVWNGIDQLGYIPKILVYPNPVTHNLHIEGLKGDETILVSDALGKIISKYSCSSKAELLELKSIPEGVYLIIVRNSKYSRTFRVVKM